MRFLTQTEGVIMDKLIDFCERLPPQAEIFTCRIGTSKDLTIFFKGILQETFEKGYTPHDKDTTETLVYDTIDDLVEECMQIAEDEGWGTEHNTLRFHAFTLDRKPIRSKVLKKDIVQEDFQSVGAVQSLTMANIRMSEEIRRTMREISLNNKEHLQTIASLSQTLVTSQKEKLLLERENMARELIMEMHDNETGDDTRSQGLSLLERIAQGLFNQQAMQGGNIDDMIKETIKNDPEKVREFMKDPDVVASIMREVMRDEEGENNDE